MIQAEEIKARMAANNVTQFRLAVAAGLSIAAVQGWLSGRVTDPKASTVEKIERAMAELEKLADDVGR